MSSILAHCLFRGVSLISNNKMWKLRLTLLITVTNIFLFLQKHLLIVREIRYFVDTVLYTIDITVFANQNLHLNFTSLAGFTLDRPLKIKRIHVLYLIIYKLFNLYQLTNNVVEIKIIFMFVGMGRKSLCLLIDCWLMELWRRRYISAR